MSDALHERRHSWLQQESAELSAINEAAVMAAGPSHSSLPYWNGPRTRRLPPTVIMEATADGGDGEGPVQDVAAASFSDLVTLEVVFGNDDRVKVDKVRLKRNPWRQICALRIKSTTNKTYVGTGWYIAPGLLATAGHCVFMQKEGGWAKSIQVIPAKYGSDEPYGKLTSQRFGSVAGWVDKGLREYDYGVILLGDRAAGKAVGNFEVQALTEPELKDAMANISGYPADRESAAYQYFHARDLTRVSLAHLEYEIDTYGGQSGSPVWLDRGNGSVVAVGIHTTGSQVGNSGTRISEPVLDNLIAWVEENEQ